MIKATLKFLFIILKTQIDFDKNLEKGQKEDNKKPSKYPKFEFEKNSLSYGASEKNDISTFQYSWNCAFFPPYRVSSWSLCKS